MARSKKEKHRSGLSRREALGRLAAGAGVSVALPALAGGAEASHASGHASAQPEGPALGSALAPDPSLAAKDWKPKFFDAHQNETVVVLSDLIIPETDTPGAKAAQVNRFIDFLLSSANPDLQKRYLEALGWLDGYCLAQYSKPFVRLAPAEQTEVLTLLTSEKPGAELAHGVELFKFLKLTVVWTYYNSEIGLVQELKYQTNPFHAEFPGCKNPDEHKIR